MMPKEPKGPDFDWQAAVCMGLGMSEEKTAAYIPVDRKTIRRHRAKIPGLWAERIAFVRGVKENFLTAVAEARNGNAEDRIKSLFDRAFRLTEKAITKAEQLGDELTLKELIQIHREFTVWSASFAASEAPKRLQVSGEIEHKHQLVPMSIFTALEGVMREQKLLPIEAEVVESTQ